ncbi:MAG TPA: restriction endonuclease subunit S [Chitinophagaceae bacterium]|nr:restriction endonuclease subunit S [Chitinophagaceae bacterium]HMU58934.1 restriction endonuclease subunit S [Chitinophagaceae bacterium]
MKYKIGDIAKLQTGLFAKPEAAGEVVYLQVRHFDEKGLLKTELYTDLKHSKVTEKHLLQEGDILFAAKGTKNFAAVYESHNPPAVASTSFFVIRLNESRVLPAYLAWYLNHPLIAKQLKEQAIGTATPSISKAVLEQLEIPVPAVQKQKLIIELQELIKKEKELQDHIEELRQNNIQQQIFKAINQ